MNPKIVIRLLGILLLFPGIFIGFCLVMALYLGEFEAIKPLGFSMGIVALLALSFYCLGNASRGSIYRREALVVVGVGWILSCLLGSLPYIFSGCISNFSGAFFESVSGFTTTGATVISDIDSLPRSILFWRMLTHWLGGMGIIVLFVAILPQMTGGAKQMFRSEVPGPVSEGLRPKIKETAIALWKIYIFLTFVETLLLVLAGMSVFEAFCHSISTIATGGFSTRNGSIAEYDNALIEIIIMVFMLISGVNFGLYYTILKGRISSLFCNAEFRVYVGIVVLVSAVIGLSIAQQYGDISTALRYSVFQTISVMTGTGLSTDDFGSYPAVGKVLLVCLMFVGGCAGSTSGGLKVSRVIVIFKIAYQEIIHVFRPQVRMSVRVGRSVVENEVVHSILVFVVSFVFIAGIGTVMMSSLGLDVVTAFSSVVACLANVGPGLDAVGPQETYENIPEAGKLILSALMLLGRLELGALLALFVPGFWRR
ncbi:MAG: TrkH family potassium uptake protein [Candidatus Latescibacterota bacterium]|nr:TrkH family potassium uptake protein [Candidatus Latescibacterota bacterium]